MSKSSRRAALSVAALLTAACGGSGESATGAGRVATLLTSLPTPTPTPALQITEGSHTLGINLSSKDNFNFERSFTNLTMGGYWSLVTPAGWVPMDLSRIAPSGELKSLDKNENATLVMAYPQPSSSGALFRCTYSGTGIITIRGESISEIYAGAHKIEFRWKLKYPHPDAAYLYLTSMAAADPVRNIDCREAKAPPNRLFSSEFLDSLRPFGVIRFLDWSNTNSNSGGVWRERTLPNAFVTGADGVALEHMVELLKELNADGWFTLPWNADEEYITKFAQYVHDNMPANRTVYVEVANEIWNGFSAGVQAEREGLAEHLPGTSNFDVRMHRYAEKTDQVMKIWTKLFEDRPSKLVRVIGTQAVNFGVSDAVLSYTDPKLIDALAVAPYFGYDLFDNGANQNANVDDLMAQLAIKADESIETMKRLKTYTGHYHKRMITYEAGQHVVTENVPLAQSIERDARMYDIYKRYLERWQDEVGDLMVLYNSTTQISKFGSWGMREYNEQPMSETPKRRAAAEIAGAQLAATKTAN